MKEGSVKIIASTKIACPVAGSKRHTVTITDDGTLHCDCRDAAERGGALAGRIMLGLPPTDGARGCGALAALVDGASTLLPLVRGTHRPKYGAWEELVFAYSGNPIFRAALDLAERIHEPTRAPVRKLVTEYVERASYRHSLGKLRFRESLRALWDVPVNDDLDKFIVSAFDDQPWSVPYMPGWKEQIADMGLALVDGKFVCGRSPADPNILYAIVEHEHGEAHWVRPHRLGRGKRLKEIV
jgi:hypothetical protein